MIRNNKWRLIISSVVILLPMLAGIVMWDKLPGTLATHWGADGTADGWSGKTFAVYVLPLILLALNWICILITVKDPKNKDQNKKAFKMVLWIVPFTSLFASGIMYSVAMGTEFDNETVMLAVLGLMFVIIGNYLPKCKQNYTIGIKLPWTIQNEENWNKTHRLGGKVWVIGGLLMMSMIFLPRGIIPFVILPVMLIIALIPTIYSYILSKRQRENGAVFVKNPYYSNMGKVSLVFSAIIIIFVLAVMFTGGVDVQCDESSLTVEATYWEDIEVAYEDIDSIEYREECDVGVRTNGFGSPRLLMGTFQNDEFGYYTRYSYTNCDACVILNIDGRVLVVSGRDVENTLKIYELLIDMVR